MEKGKPSYPLSMVKRLIAAGKIRATFRAQTDAAALGFDMPGITAEALKLEANEFYKSMTAYRNHHVWQDVYRHKAAAGMLYVKLTVIDDVLVVSFKEL